MEQSLALRQEFEVGDIVNQVKKIQELMEAVMKLDVHYGTIPGTPKPTLYKAGAEKLGLIFRLSIDADNLSVIEEDLGGGHKNFRVVCPLIHMPTGNQVGAGLGSCNTMETKYKYRNEFIDSGEPIPKDYKENKGAYKANGFVAKKINDAWYWGKQERIEHDNPADYYNTCEKMAKKRAFVDAILTTTAASDFFTQDIEDLSGFEPAVEQPMKDPIKMPIEKEKPSSKADTKISEAQRKRIFAIAKAKDIPEENVKTIIRAYGYEHTGDILRKDYDKICDELNVNQESEPEKKTDGKFKKWAELAEEEIEDVFIELHASFDDNKERLESEGIKTMDDVLKKFFVRGLNPKEMTPDEYWQIYNYLNKE